MSQLFVYLDEAGHSSNTDTVVFAGLAGLAPLWAGFENEWATALAEAGVREFHMKDLETCHGEFRGWDELRQKRPFLAEITELILRRGLISVGAAVSVKWFNSLDRNEYPNHEFFEDPYHLALLEVCHVLGTEVAPHENATEVSVTLAEQPEYQGQGRGYYEATAALVFPDRFSPKVDYAKSKVVPMLQAADLVAYELRKACDNHSAQRWPMRQLRCNSHMFRSKGLSISSIFGVPSQPYSEPQYVMKIKRELVARMRAK